MRKYSVLTIIICLVFIVSTLTAATESAIVDSMLFQGAGTEITLDDAIETVIKNNPDIISSQMVLDQAKEKYKASKSQIESTRKYYSSIEKREDTLDYMQNIQLATLTNDFLITSAEMNLNALTKAQKSLVEQLYFSLQQTLTQCDIQKENLEISKALYAKIVKKYELGLVARQEVLNGEIGVINAETAYNASLNSITKAKMALNQLLGYELMNELILKDELSYREFKLESIKKAIIDAIENSNSMKTLETTYKTEDLKLKITERQYPEGTYVYNEQKIKVSKALKDLEDEKKDIEKEVRENYLDVIQKQDEIRSGKKSVELAEEALKLSQTTYDAGLGLLTDVQSAQLSLQQKKLSLSRAILDYNLAVLKFNNNLGV